MAYIGRFGYPVPEVFAVDGADLVMARVDGPTMSESLVAGKLAVGALGAAAAQVRGDR
jgi:tRNA A-37 threonylcarbamoyl transferase component Bud32